MNYFRNSGNSFIWDTICPNVELANEQVTPMIGSWINTMYPVVEIANLQVTPIEGVR